MSTVAAGTKSVARSVPRVESTRDARAFLLGVLVVTPVAAANGGYFPTSWAWPTVALAWIAGLAVLLRPLVRLSRLEIACCSALGLFALWTGASALWSPNVGQTVLVFERTLIYVAGVAAALLVMRSGSYRALLAGVAGATTLVTSYAVLTRIYPDRFHFDRAVSGNRLAAPLGYWNGLGLFAALGILLLVGFAAHAHQTRGRIGATVALFPHVLALYFTFSRGAWAALAIGALVLIVLDTRRMRLILSLFVTAPFLAVVVLYASRQKDLTQVSNLGPSAASEGRHIALLAFALAIAAGTAMLAVTRAERRLRVPQMAERLSAPVLAAGAIVALLAVFVHYGSPQSLARRGWNAFNAPPVAAKSDLNARLFTLSGSWRADLWRVALDDTRAHPLLGSGAGTYREEWLSRRTVATDVVNAHNLYLETLAELGPLGLGLLLVALGTPLVAGFRARRRTLVPVATAAYVAFLVHAGVDWDWQLPGLTLAALFTAAAILGAARRDAHVRLLGTKARAAVVAVLFVIALVSGLALLPNRATRDSGHAILQERFGAAENSARTAHDWAPWDARPLQLLGEAQLQQGRFTAAAANFREAIAKDRGSYELWLDLALATKGRIRRDAAHEALRLNPLSSEIASIRPALGLKAVAK
jgi:hypothetical protein